MRICMEYAALLDAFVDGELTAEEMLRVQEHLAGCSACQAYVDDILAIRAAFPDAEDAAVPEGFAEAVSAAIRAGAAPRKKQSAPWVRTMLPLAACCAIVILLAKTPMATRSAEADQSPALRFSESAAEEDAAALEPAEYGLASAEEALPGEDGMQKSIDLPETVLDNAADISGDPAENRERGAVSAGNGLDTDESAPAVVPDAGIAPPSGPEVPQASVVAGKSVEEQNAQPEAQSNGLVFPQMTSAVPMCAWVPAAQEDLLAGYVEDIDENGVSFRLLTGEEYGALLDALAEREASAAPDSPAKEDAGEFVRVYVREE